MKRILTLGLSLFLITAAASAQLSPRDGVRDHRISNRDHRISNDVRKGQLTRPERFQLRRDALRYQTERRHARRDGYISRRERHRLHKMRRHQRFETHRFRHNRHHRMV